jgi:hypothetical protein
MRQQHWIFYIRYVSVFSGKSAINDMLRFLVTAKKTSEKVLCTLNTWMEDQNIWRKKRLKLKQYRWSPKLCNPKFLRQIRSQPNRQSDLDFSDLFNRINHTSKSIKPTISITTDRSLHLPWIKLPALNLPNPVLTRLNKNNLTLTFKKQEKLWNSLQNLSWATWIETTLN